MHFGFNYGNTGCRVFLAEGTKLEIFLPKNQHTQRKFLNFEYWCGGEPSIIILVHTKEKKIRMIF